MPVPGPTMMTGVKGSEGMWKLAALESEEIPVTSIIAYTHARTHAHTHTHTLVHQRKSFSIQEYRLSGQYNKQNYTLVIANFLKKQGTSDPISILFNQLEQTP